MVRNFLIAVSVGISCFVCRCGFAEWKEIPISNKRKAGPHYYNSQRLVVDRGHPAAVYVGRAADDTKRDLLYFSRFDGENWREQEVFAFEHSGHAAAGINGLAMALGPQNRPHLFVYTSDYPIPNSVFQERWFSAAGRKWNNRLIRRSVNKLGGAALHDAHLAVSGRGFIHVVGYMHSGFGTAHRARHRYFDGRSYQVDALPRPPGKTDSSPANLMVDGNGTVHFAYDSKKAYNRGNAEAGYPDSSVHYVTWRNGRWGTPETVSMRVGPEPDNTKFFVESIGIAMDQRGAPCIAYTASKKKKHDTKLVYLARRMKGRWSLELVYETGPDESGTFRSAVFNPMFDRSGKPVLAFDSPEGTIVAQPTDTGWSMDSLPGDLEGFVVDGRGAVHVTTSRDNRLTYHFLSNRLRR